ncbi:MAG: M1 family metallopeptidase [Sphingomonadales bacterium]|nr:M1 family metallopeptidase [Sphingomonadales bacterium]
MRQFNGKYPFYVVFYAILVAFQSPVRSVSTRPICQYTNEISGPLPDHFQKKLESAEIYTRKCRGRELVQPYRVRYYDLHITMDTLSLVHLPGRSQAVLPIKGRVDMHIEARGESAVGQKNRRWPPLEFDAGSQVIVDSIFIGQVPVAFKRRGSRICVDERAVPKEISHGRMTLTAFFHSYLVPASKPPWEDGVVVSSDDHGRPWLGMTCQTSGASSWWPCFDRLSDEPDSVRLTFGLPEGSPALVTNGINFPPEMLPDQRVYYRALVSYPINLYNITFNIADYGQFGLSYQDMKGEIRQLKFHMLARGVEQAREYFSEAQTMMKGFEEVFGPYAFWRDGYKVVETPYWGMEHQSCVAYGNRLKRNKYGFDFILVHESAHEWWGNAVSACRPHDLWIHEGLATWSESRLLEWRHPDSSLYTDYMVGLRERIRNRQPVAASAGTNKRKLDTDIYYKAAWMWHSLRHSMPEKSRFDEILREFYQHFTYKNLDTRQLTEYWCRWAGDEYAGFFRQYLLKSRLPVLTCRRIEVDTDGMQTLKLRYRRVSPDFQMPLHLGGMVCSPRNDASTTIKVRGDVDLILMDLTSKYLLDVRFREGNR